MNDSSATTETLPEHEQAILDTALLESDQLLARSLHDDQRRRQRQWLLALAIGGVVMSGMVIAVLGGWLAVSAQVTADGTQSAQKVLTKQENEELARENLVWRKRLLAASNNDPWHVGANIGMDLMRIEGDRPYMLLKDNWKKIDVDVRKQILKGFTPGMMGNKTMHPRFFDVMHLGMSDRSAGVREYAASYIEMQGLPNFQRKLSAYKKWRKQTEGMTAEAIVAQAKTGDAAAVESDASKLVDGSKEEASKQEDEQWKKRLQAIEKNAPWHVGANIGMELVQMPGDRPHEILSSNWKKIPSGSRKQILKGFTPGMMGNKEMHPQFFDVMHLGMSDSDAGVRSYAAAYLEMQGLPNFEKKPAAYKRWRKETAELSAEEIMKRVE